MKLAWLNAANWLMHGLHLVVLGWNVFGWMYRPWWPWHRLCVALTLASWVVLGLIVGRLGYCVLTDWHWRIRAALGARDLPDTYIAFLVRQGGRLSQIEHLVGPMPTADLLRYARLSPAGPARPLKALRRAYPLPEHQSKTW